MKKRKLGKTGFEVSEIGFGAWAIGGSWGSQDDNESIGALHKALDLGLDFIDTAEGYGDGKSERIIAQVLKDRGEKITVATKTPPLPGIWPPSPYCQMEERYPEAYLRKNIEERLRNLDTDSLDLLQLHSWTRAWNTDPKPFQVLRKLQEEGKIKAIGVSTPEQDQHAVMDLIRNGWVDTVQIIYNLFEQEPAAGLLPLAKECDVGVIVRVALDEGVLAGKYSEDKVFEEDDFRGEYFAGDRLGRAVKRVDKIREAIAGSGYNMPQIALKFPLMHEAVSTVIAGTRNADQAEANCGVSDLPYIPDSLLNTLHQHNWRRGVWYGGK